MITNREWDEAHESWVCPSCLRDKAGVARLTSTGVMQAKLVWHHDHFRNAASIATMAAVEKLQPQKAAALLARARHMLDYLDSFKTTLICEDCNHTEARAKAYVAAPPDFSFGPLAILWVRNLEQASGFKAKLVESIWLRKQIGLGARRWLLNTFLQDRGEWWEPEPGSPTPAGWDELRRALAGGPIPRGLLLSRRG